MLTRSKLRKHKEGAKNVDFSSRINSLPDELLGHMLSFLPTKVAVSTSILSKRWRYLFTLTNCLSFEDAPYSLGMAAKKIKADTGRRFKMFVYDVLKSHVVSPIKKFSLVCRHTHVGSDLNAWVSTVIQKGVQDLHFMFVEQKEAEYELPDELFTCETLMRLKMIGFTVWNDIRIPLSAWLPSLKVLYLQGVKFIDDNSVERLFSGCEFLEELTLKKCKCDTHCRVVISTGVLRILSLERCLFAESLFEIDAPNLRRLTCCCNSGVRIVPSWKYLCSLTEAKLTFNHLSEFNLYSDSLQHDLILLEAAARKVTSLHLMGDSVELFLTLGDYKQMPDFLRLSTLRVAYCRYRAWKHVTNLLDKSPQLDSLHFDSDFIRCFDNLEPPKNEALIPFSCSVKMIEVRAFRSSYHSLIFLRDLLRNAIVLKRLICVFSCQ